MQTTKIGFSQRHPFLFGMTVLFAAMALLVVAIAVFVFLFVGKQTATLGRDSFGLVNVEGMISESREITEWIAELRDARHVRGVVVRINSPGGAVGPSQEIFRAVRRLNKEKPVVVSMGAVAASGAYYVACPAKTILANPSTITGSIGVRMELANFMGLMDKIGVGHEAITSGKFKDTGTPFRELSPEEREYFKGIIADMFDQFITDVAQTRKLDQKKIREIADGRVLTGRQALAEGLIDGIGGLEDAYDLLKKYCNISKVLPILEGPKEDVPWLRKLLLSMDATLFKEQARSEWRFVYR